MSEKQSRKNWEEEETVKLVQLVYEQREYLRHKLRKNKRDRIWEELFVKFITVNPKRSVEQLKNKWDNICQVYGTGAGTTNLPTRVNEIMQSILDEEALLNQGTDVSESLASGGSAPSPTPNIAPASQPISGESNSSSQDVPNQAENQGRLDELIELVKTLDLRVKNLENDPKKKE